ncbi:MAG: hypothetical protein ACYC5A_10705 [Thermoleophilia bacterium]
MKIAVTESFRRCYEKLPVDVQDKAERQIVRISEDLRHPSLRVKKIKGAPGIWEARVDRGYRMTFTVKEEIIFLRRIGPHDQTLKQPQKDLSVVL